MLQVGSTGHLQQFGGHGSTTCMDAWSTEGCSCAEAKVARSSEEALKHAVLTMSIAACSAMPWFAAEIYCATISTQCNIMAVYAVSALSIVRYSCESAVTLTVCSVISSSERGAAGGAGGSAKRGVVGVSPCNHHWFAKQLESRQPKQHMLAEEAKEAWYINTPLGTHLAPTNAAIAVADDDALLMRR